jgi:hypothetical protein
MLEDSINSLMCTGIIKVDIFFLNSCALVMFLLFSVNFSQSFRVEFSVQKTVSP